MNSLQILLTLLILGTFVLYLGLVNFYYPSSFNVIPRNVAPSPENGSSAINSETNDLPTGNEKDNFSLRELSQGIGQIHDLFKSNERTHTNKDYSNSNSSHHQQGQRPNTTLYQDEQHSSSVWPDSAIQTKQRPQERRQQHQQSQCIPRQNIVLLKTHKTGSSTLQNILYRFGDSRELSFVLPPVDVYLGSPMLFRARFAIPSARGYNILANHARFNEETMTSIMPRDSKYISIVRFPPDQFESMYSYYGFNNRFKTSVEGFAKNPNKYYAREEAHPRHSALNPVLYDLGLGKKLLSSPSAIDKWIKHIDKSFDLILIAEYLYESLVLLKELMCWSWDDITFFSSNKRNQAVVKSLPVETVKQLLDWQRGDYKLYLYFNRTLHEKIAKYGVKRMQADAEYLKSRNEALATACLRGTKEVKEMHGRTVIDRYVLKPGSNKTCARMTHPAYEYLTMLRKRQKLMKNT